jgi:hypothetical protein
MSDTGVESPSAAMKGTKHKGLKALASIPAGFIMLPFIGAIVGPAEVMEQTGTGQVRRLQKRFTEAYETYADKNMLENLHTQVVSRVAERLDNPVLKVPLSRSSDSASYKQRGNIDTVLELRTIVVGLQLTGLSKHSVTVTEQAGEISRTVQRTIQEPEAQFAMVVEYGVISAEDDAQIGTDERADYTSTVKTLAGWTADGGAA